MLRNALIAAGAVVVLLLGFGVFQYVKTLSVLNETQRTLLQTKTEAAETRAKLEEDIRTKTEENVTLAGELRLLQEEHDDSKKTVRKLSNTVEDLEKIVAADPELLAKYSKVYFLNENYVPRALKVIDSIFAFQEDRVYEIHADVEPFLEDLLEDAKKDGFDLLVASSYRSFAAQTALKAGYKVRYGTGANAFSAEQGYSEHQLGTTVDLTTRAVGGTFAGFDKSKEYEWLTKNAWRYGFILSYPKGNTYYQYEPWHWRFVGKDLAERLHEDEDNFYDLDQRTIDEYLGKIFD